MLTPNPEEGWVPPTPDQIKYETYGILAAAADTTGNGLTTGVHEVIRNPEIYAKLTAELETAFPDPDAKMELSVLERLPYLSGVVNESLRLSFGVISRGSTRGGTRRAMLMTSVLTWAVLHSRVAAGLLSPG
jgi:hypothetical protein